MASRIQHGASLFELQEKCGFSTDEIVGFSSNVNPFSPDRDSLDYLVQHTDRTKAYPDPKYRQLRSVLSSYIHCPPDQTVLGTGATNLLSAYVALVHPTDALLNSPCYSEYGGELERVETRVRHHLLDRDRDFALDPGAIIDQIKDLDTDLYVLTNPNNPIGSIPEAKDIERVLQEAQAYLLIDETYIEFTDLAPYTACQLACNYDRFFVIRSTSKFFASPSIRLGYGVLSHGSRLQTLQDQLNLWDINIYAEIMGEGTFLNKDYQDQIYQHTKSERARMIQNLEKLPGLGVCPSQGNSVLCQLKNSPIARELKEELLPKKLTIQDCANFSNLGPDFFRFCILSREANDALLKAPEEILT